MNPVVKIMLKDFFKVLGTIVFTLGLFALLTVVIISLPLYTELSYEFTHGWFMMSVKWGIAGLFYLFIIFIIIGGCIEWYDSAKWRLTSKDNE